MAAAAGIGNFVGGLALTARKTWSASLLKVFVALGAGFMLAVAFLEVLPASQQHTTLALPAAFAGYLLVHLFEHGLVPHFHFGEETHHHGEFLTPAGGTGAFVALTLHSFLDGISIASGFLVSFPLGTLLFLAILIHKLPEGFTLASILLLTGRSRRQALGGAAALGVACVAGALAMNAARQWLGLGLALSAGATLYVAASDLLPEANREEGVTLPLTVFGGVLLYLCVHLILRTAL
ncbi:MAG: ZIP family metal transporter [Gemmatimonadetes bacterium]|nr:ZIP family metal transporter [Gemmatimonadota bacterium]